MRIVHVTHQFQPETHGGLEGYVLDLAREQLRNGHEVEIVSGSLTPRPEVQVESVATCGLTVHRLHRSDLYFDSWDKTYCPAISRLYRDRLRSIGPDLVHLHHWIRLSDDIGTVTKSLGLPLVVTLHDYALTCPRCFRIRPRDDSICTRRLSISSCIDCVPRRPWQGDAIVGAHLEEYRSNGKRELAAADRIVVASASLRDAVCDNLDTPRDAFECVPLAYEPRFQAVTRAPVSRRPKRLAFWGAITARKGVDLLIDAFRRALEHPAMPRDAWHLDLFGRIETAELESQLVASASDLPVSFHGRFDYAQLASRGIWAAVFPSTVLETYGLVLDEALELGVPAIVPDLGAMASRLDGCGMTFRIGDVTDLSERLLDMAQEERRAALSNGLPRRGKTMPDHVREIDSVYERAMAASRSKPETENRSTEDESRAILAFDAREEMFRRLIEREGPGNP